MTLDEELALIRQNKAPNLAPPAVAAISAPAAEDPYANLILPSTDIAAPPAQDASTWDVLGAAWQAETVSTDAWNHKSAKERALAEAMMRRLPGDVQARIMDPMQRENEWARLPELVTAEAARLASASPEAAADWAGFPLTLDAFNQQIDNERRAELDEAQAILDQPGGAVSEFLGRSARAMTDQTSLMLLPFGISGSALRTIAGEAVLGGIGEAAVLPREFQVAQELDLPAPDAMTRIATGVLAGGLFSGAIIGIGKTVQWARARHMGAQAAMPAGANPPDFYAGVDAAEAALRGDRTVQETFSPRGAAPGTLGDVLALTDGLRLPGAEALPYNEGATITAIIGVESGGNATARNPSSSATGAGQFIASTWLDMMRRYEPDRIAGLTDNQILALREDPNLSVKMTAMYARENTAKMTAAGIQGIGPGEVYLAHFMGPGGAIRALQAPLDTPITALMSPKEIAANKRIRFNGKFFADFTAGDLRAWSQRKMRAAYDPNAIADLPSYAPTTRGFTGTGQVRAGDEFTIDVAYEVVDLSSLTRASGDLQPRDRSRIASDAWIADTAARLDPVQLMPSPTADRGTPIVGPDNIIESGNGRFGAIERAYDRHPDRAAAYRAQIEAAGYAVPEGVERPVLIARRTSELAPDQRAQFAVAAQDSGVAVMTPTEVARASSRAMTAPVLAQLDPTKPLADAINGAFVRAALSALPRSARNAMFDASGMLNANGLRQLREAIFARAWPDPDILARYTEGDAGDLKSLLEALDSAAPSFAALKADIEAGLVSPEMDISGYVLDAMRLIGAARDLATATKVPVAKAVAELLDDVDLIEGAVAPLTAALVRRFWKGGKAAAADDVAGFLTRYADDARKAGATGGMFDAPGPRDVLIAIDAKAFGDLPEDLGNIRGFARPGQDPAREAAAAADPGPGFDAGASAPDAVAADAEIRAAIEEPVDLMPTVKALLSQMQSSVKSAGTVDDLKSKLIRYGALAKERTATKAKTAMRDDRLRIWRGQDAAQSAAYAELKKFRTPDIPAEMIAAMARADQDAIFAAEKALDPIGQWTGDIDRGVKTAQQIIDGDEFKTFAARVWSDKQASAPDAVAADAEIRAALDAPVATTPSSAAEILTLVTGTGPRQIIDASALAVAEQEALFAGLKAAQPYDDITSLMAAAERNHAQLNDVAEMVAEKLSLKFQRAPLKLANRVIEKVTAKYRGKFRLVADVARTGITAPDMASADAFIAALGQRFHIIDEGWQVTPAGYFDRKLMVRFDDGQLGEIQIWPPGMLDAKKSGGHKLYEVSRDPTKSPEVRAVAVEEMRALYGKVRDKLDPSFAQKLGFDTPIRSRMEGSSSGGTSSALSSPSTSAAISSEPPSGPQVPSVQNIARPAGETTQSSAPDLKNVMGGVPSTFEDATDVKVARQNVNALRGQFDDFEIEMPDGTTVTVRDVLDDLDADAQFDAFVQACAIIPGGAQ